MSQKISQLTAATTLALADEFPIVADNDGLNYRATMDQVRKALGDPLRFGQTVSQAGTNDPGVGNTLCNTMGAVGVTWERRGTGQYSAVFSGITFVDTQKLIVMIGAQNAPSGAGTIALTNLQYQVVSSTRVDIFTFDSFGAQADDLLSHYIEFNYYDV